ncbi:MAG: GAF domain-containing protein [Limnochordaceae bacterium]|nr:GAF domain-containing protein [Limnochordaceae bacterium]
MSQRAAKPGAARRVADLPASRAWKRLLDAVRGIDTIRDEPATHRLLTSQAISLLGADGAAVFTVDEAGTIRCAWSEGVSATYTAAVSRVSQLVPGGRVVRTGRPAVILDASRLERWPRLAELARAEGIRTIGLFPMVLDGRTVAVLAVYHRRVRRYRTWEVRALTAFSYQASLALGGARLFDETRRRAEELQQMYDRVSVAYRQLKAFQEIGMEIASSLDPAQVLRTVARYAAELTGSDAGAVFEYDPQEGVLAVTASHGVEDAFVEGIRRARVRPGDGAIGRAVAERRPVQVADVESEPGYAFLHLTRPQGFRSILAVPMASGEEMVGGLVVWRKEPGLLDRGAVDWLVALAQQSTAAIRNARLFAALERAYDDTLEALTAALDVRDRDTEGHSRRVAALALAIAREMGLPTYALQALYRGGLLHDIGKIGIPDNILHKRGPLDDREWEIMRQHPLLGFRVLEGIQFLRDGATVVLHHHERYDGRGYPMGLQAERIPIIARIFAVADAYDAMTSWRPYRAPIPPDQAVEEIVRNSGSQFDPEVVQAFLRVIQAGQAATGDHRHLPGPASGT